MIQPASPPAGLDVATRSSENARSSYLSPAYLRLLPREHKGDHPPRQHWQPLTRPRDRLGRLFRARDGAHDLERALLRGHALVVRAGRRRRVPRRRDRAVASAVQSPPNRGHDLRRALRPRAHRATNSSASALRAAAHSEPDRGKRRRPTEAAASSEPSSSVPKSPKRGSASTTGPSSSTALRATGNFGSSRPMNPGPRSPAPSSTTAESHRPTAPPSKPWRRSAATEPPPQRSRK
ncbi:hypothetical protein H4W30_007603 [Amycolatopsis roodepoortensis]|uniref:Uncharacterized protein n=1 Tax=Amycolatopsis roodepoortensis TaxID=700274 RepID=A0ABR9LIX9_9PSEU|nr:hypothetical protein [Amycolatopsis roodepoortensis]